MKGLLLALLLPAAAFAQSAPSAEELHERLSKAFLAGESVTEQVPEAALDALESAGELKKLRTQAAGIQQGRDPSEEPAIFRKSIELLSVKLQVPSEPAVALYGKRVRPAPAVAGSHAPPRPCEEQELSAAAVETLLKDPHVDAGRKAQLQTRAQQYARSLGSLTDLEGASSDAALNASFGGKRLTTADYQRLNSIPSGPYRRVDNGTVPQLSPIKQASVDASNYWTLAAADRINQARDANGLIAKTYQYGVALGDSAMAETAALWRGDPEVYHRAAVGATVGVSIVGATAVTGPAAAIGLGFTALNTYTGVESVGEAIDRPSMKTIGFATFNVAGAPLIGSTGRILRFGKYADEAEAMVGLENRGFRPPPGTRAAPESVPEEWIIKQSKRGNGVMFVDPANEGNVVRVMPGNAGSKFPNSKRPYVRWQVNGQPLDANGNILKTSETAEAHIPLEQFKFDPKVYKK